MLRLPGSDFPQLCDPTCDDTDFDAEIQHGQAELARRQEAEKERIRQDERDRIEKENLLKTQQAEKAEADRVAKMGDKEKWTEWTTTIKSTAPAMSTKEGKKDVENILDMIKRTFNNFQ